MRGHLQVMGAGHGRNFHPFADSAAVVWVGLDDAYTAAFDQVAKSPARGFVFSTGNWIIQCLGDQS